jgi:hypothetical protein
MLERPVNAEIEYRILIYVLVNECSSEGLGKECTYIIASPRYQFDRNDKQVERPKSGLVVLVCQARSKKMRFG